MMLTNNYFWFRSALSPKTCQKIIKHGLNRLKQDKKEGVNTSGTTFGDNHKQAIPNSKPQKDKTLEDLSKELGKSPSKLEKERYIRDSEVTWFNDQWVYDIITPFLIEANNKAGWKYQWDFCESFQFTIYHPGGFYGWHADGNSDHLSKYKRYVPGVSPTTSDGKMLKSYTDNPNMVNKIRKLSMTINLNAPGEYDGGNLKFDFGPHTIGERFHECKEIRPQGSIVVFPSFVYHQVTPVTRGTRYSLVLWCLGWPFQ